MKKMISFIIIAILIVAIIVIFVVMNGKGATNNKTNLPQVSNVAELTDVLNKIYEGTKVGVYNVETREIDLTDDTSVKSYTGLKNGEQLEYAIVSEPLINAQAYSLVMAKVKNGVNANEIAKEMSEGIDTRKWICVSAEKLYATNSGDIVFLIMTNEEMAKGVYDSFKELAKNVGKEYEKTTEEEALPDDTESDIVIPMPQ